MITKNSQTHSGFLYKPSRISILFDILFLTMCIFVVLRFFPLTTRNPFEKYDIAAVIYFGIWLVVSYFLGRYKPLHLQKYLYTSFNLFYATIITFLSMWGISHYIFDQYFTVGVLFSFTTAVFFVNSAFHFLYFAILYAANYEEQAVEPEIRTNAVLKPATVLDDESYRDLCSVIIDYSGENVFNELSKTVDLRSGNTYVSFSEVLSEFKAKPIYKYSTIINLQLLNNIRGINKLLSIINSKLPDNGIFICCFETKSTVKKRFLKKLPNGINYMAYSVLFLIERFIPKLFITKRLYYDITGGKNRVLSKTEVLGRLYLCGFEILKEKKIGQYNYVYARRIKQPDQNLKRFHGPLIKLRRIGKDGKKFNVYKFRTMHPYSEFLQAYIYSRNSLQEGGKFKRDIRVTTLGRIMRKYWLDELPMLINLARGNMKLVGVRPLSAQYFSLYSKELQELRTKFKPGLLPPFYADMPKTLEEIEKSEMNYLLLCTKNGTFLTDIKYFFLIIRNIIFRSARSA